MDRHRYCQGSLACRGGEVGCGLVFGCRWEVVAAEQADREVGEQHWPERDHGAVVAGGVGGDDGVVGGDSGVEVGVVGERDLDDAVHALAGGVGTDNVDRVGLIERDSVRDGWVDRPRDRARA